MNASTNESAASYLEAWRKKDVQAIARHLHTDVRFTGPMMKVSGRDAVIASAQRILPIVEELVIRSTFISGNQAMLVYDFVCAPPIGRCRTAELVTFEEGLIRDIELFYDARPFEHAVRASAAT